jgi:hypothetical protein
VVPGRRRWQPRYIVCLWLTILSSRAWATNAEDCAASEAIGRFDVTCYGADPAFGNNDTDGVFRALCHLYRATTFHHRTLYFPAGEYRVNLGMQVTNNVPGGITEFEVAGADRDSTVLIKDLSQTTHSGAWSISDSIWRNSIDPDTCRGDWIYGWDHDDYARSIAFIEPFQGYLGNFTARDITLSRSPRATAADDYAILSDSPAIHTLTNVSITDFFDGIRLA